MERAQTRLLPVLNRSADYVPMAPACCNACRACMTTNVAGLAFAAVGAASALAVRLGRRALAVRRP
jgi:hypothetical protein